MKGQVRKLENNAQHRDKDLAAARGLCREQVRSIVTYKSLQRSENSTVKNAISSLQVCESCVYPRQLSIHAINVSVHAIHVSVHVSHVSCYHVMHE